jgi:putative hydrolase of the HAD superfamily
MRPKYRAALFDLDDTLLDHQLNRREALTAVARIVPAMSGIDVLELEAAHDVHLQDMRRLLRGFGVEADDTLANRCEDAYRTGYDRNWRMVPGARELMAALRELGLRIGIVTNGLTSQQMLKLDRLGLNELVDHVSISEAVGSQKPERAFFEHALAGIACAPDECVVIGDIWDIDVRGALDAGIDAIWLNRYGRRADRHPRVVEVTSWLPTEDALALFLQNAEP